MPDGRDMRTAPAAAGAPESLREAVKALAESRPLLESSRLLQDERQWIDERHLEICRVPALTFREQERASTLRRLFADIGVKSQTDEAGNVVAPIVYGPDLPFIAVTAHMDTTLAPRRPEDIRVAGDGSFQGPGVTDNGAGLAALLALGRVLRAGRLVERPTRNIVLVANVAEEGEGNLHGMKYLCGQSSYAGRFAECLVVDGASTAHLTVEALGSRRFEILLEGRGGHSWNDFGRANPVHALSRAVALLADIELPRSPRATLTVAAIEGGAGVNSIAASARAKVDIRSRSASAINRVVSAMEDAVRLAVERENRRASDRLQSYRIREIGHRPAASRLAENRVADCLQAVDARLGVRSRLDCASTDANVPLAMGIPAAAIGAGGRGGDAHTPTEWYHPEGRALGIQRILLAIALLQAQ